MLLDFLCFDKKNQKVGEKQSIMSLSMFDRDISILHGHSWWIVIILPMLSYPGFHEWTEHWLHWNSCP